MSPVFRDNIPALFLIALAIVSWSFNHLLSNAKQDPALYYFGPVQTETMPGAYEYEIRNQSPNLMFEDVSIEIRPIDDQEALKNPVAAAIKPCKANSNDSSKENPNRSIIFEFKTYQPSCGFKLRYSGSPNTEVILRNAKGAVILRKPSLYYYILFSEEFIVLSLLILSSLSALYFVLNLRSWKS